MSSTNDLKRRSRQRLLCFTLSSLLALTACQSAVSEEGWRVRFTHVYTASSDYQLMAERFRDLMERRTGGRFRVVIYPSAQLGGERVAFEQLQSGATHMAISGTPVLSGWVPEDRSSIFRLLSRRATKGSWSSTVRWETGGARAFSRELGCALSGFWTTDSGMCTTARDRSTGLRISPV